MKEKRNAMLEVLEIYKDYENQPLLRGVSLRVEEGETVCLLGASGSGKSTLLRIIAGLEQAEAGRVLWDGQDLTHVPVHQRHFGLMFQDYALFPHRSVAENVGFGLRMQGIPNEELERRVTESLALVDLTAFARRRVTELSGGEQQRVALARALAPRPRLLMLDEPLGALDRALRTELLHELRQLLHSFHIPAIYVTHDQEEAFSIADRLILLHEGRVAQAGSPDEVYLHPASPWVAHFLGLDNLLPGTVTDTAGVRVRTALGELTAGGAACPTVAVGERVQLLLRPGGLRRADEADGCNQFTGLVEDVVFQGAMYQVVIRCAGDLRFHFTVEQPLPQGAEMVFCLDAESITCLMDGGNGSS
jgi:ABC-type Fe3+/spermidine/putrescine transport system ATPase subunit